METCSFVDKYTKESIELTESMSSAGQLNWNEDAKALRKKYSIDFGDIPLELSWCWCIANKWRNTWICNHLLSIEQAIRNMLTYNVVEVNEKTKIGHVNQFAYREIEKDGQQIKYCMKCGKCQRCKDWLDKGE